MKSVAVFCASSGLIDEVYKQEAERLGEAIGRREWELVFGGTNRGLMRIVGHATQAAGGKTLGIIPETLRKRGIAAKWTDREVVTPDMKERKAMMREHADAFIALPGGWGTLEEIIEVITLKQLGEHAKPIVFLNTAGFYNTFLAFIAEAREKQFISAAYDSLYHVADSVEGVMAYLDGYVFEGVEAKY